MSNAYLVRKEERLIFEVWIGKITKDELFEHERQQLLDPDFPFAPRVLVDITGASFDPAIGKTELGQFVDLYRHHHDKTVGARVAIVAAEDFARAETYGKLAERQSVRVIVFNDVGTACIWLGVSAADAQEWIVRTRAELLRNPPREERASPPTAEPCSG